MANKYTSKKYKISGNGGAGKYNPNHKPEKMSLEECMGHKTKGAKGIGSVEGERLLISAS